MTNSSPKPNRTGIPLKYRDFVCGFGASTIETSFTFPLNKVIFRQKLHNISAKEGAKQLFSEGFIYLYRGLTPRLCQRAPTKAVMFGTFDFYSKTANCGDVRKTTFNTCNACAAFLAGFSEAIFTPFERIQTLMQTAEHHGRFQNTFRAFHIVGKYGFTEYYRGFCVIIMRNGPSTACFFGLRQPLHDLVTSSARKSDLKSEAADVMTHFIIGAMLGAVLSTLYFPLNVVRVRLQSKLGGDFERAYPVLKEILAQRNYSVKELFRGVHLNCAKSFITWGFTNAIYEFLKWTFF